MTTGEFGEKTFTTFEVARLCGVFHTTVINWVNKGKLKARVTPGGHRRIPISELVLFMKKYEMPIPADIEDAHKQILILDDEPMMTRLLELASPSQLTRLQRDRHLDGHRDSAAIMAWRRSGPSGKTFPKEESA